MKLMKGGIQERSDARKEGFRKGDMQGRRDSGKERCKEGGIQERRDARKEGSRKEVMQGRRDSGKERCKERGIQERSDARKEGFRKGATIYLRKAVLPVVFILTVAHKKFKLLR